MFGAKKRRSTDHLRVETQTGRFDISSSSGDVKGGKQEVEQEDSNVAPELSAFSASIDTARKQLSAHGNHLTVMKGGLACALFSMYMIWSKLKISDQEKKQRNLDVPGAPQLQKHNPNALTIFQRLSQYQKISPVAKQSFFTALKYMEEIVRRRVQMQETKSCVAEDMEIFNRLSQAICLAVIRIKTECRKQKDFNDVDITLTHLVQELQHEAYAYQCLTMSSDVNGNLDC